MGEIVLARLSGRLSICQLSRNTSSGKQVRLRIGRNREAKLPARSVVYKTGLKVGPQQNIAKFIEKCQKLAKSINIRKAWELLVGDSHITSAAEIAALTFEHGGIPENIIAVYINIDVDPLFFEIKQGEIHVRTEEQVSEINAKRSRIQREQQEEDSLISMLELGEFEEPLTDHQKGILVYIRNFAIHGDNYSRSALVLGILKRYTSGNTDQLQRSTFNQLVVLGILSEDTPTELERSEIPVEFHESTLAEARTLKISEVSTIDLTDIPTFTIDDEETLDRDDAFSEKNGVVWVHITDVSNLISQESAIEREANQRTSTLYLPDRKIPMLPNRISEEIGSLNPKAKRICLSLKLEYGLGGNITRWSFHRTLIRSNQALTYLEADSILMDLRHPLHKTLSNIQKLTDISRNVRMQKGALNFDKREMRVHPTCSGSAKVEVSERNSASKTLVAELMILYNNLAGEFCQLNHLPAPYRLQQPPNEPIPINQADGPLKWFTVGRLLKKATVSTSPGEHFGLGLKTYTRATSPLRRYSDLCVQRQINQFIEFGDTKYGLQAMSAIAHRSEIQMKEISRIESARVRYWFLKYLRSEYLEPNRSAVFSAVMLEPSVTQRSLFELTAYPFRARCVIPSHLDQGAEFKVTLAGVDLWHRSAQFIYERHS